MFRSIKRRRGYAICFGCGNRRNRDYLCRARRKKGVYRAAFGIVTFLLAAVLAFMFYGPFSDYVITTPAGQTVEQNLYDSIYKAVAGNAAQPQHEGAEQAAPEMEQAAPEPERQKPAANTTEDVLNAMKIPQFMFQSVFAQSDFLGPHGAAYRCGSGK